MNLDAYEVVRPLPASGLATVAVARRRDRPREYVVLKILRPASVFARPEEARRFVDQFLQSAACQDRVARAEPAHWAPVHESGPVPDGAACVTDYYSRSVEGLARGRVRLSLRDVAGLAGAVLDGLIALERTAGRPHGNLKPSNVLLAGRGKVRPEHVFLTDPLADSVIDPAKHRLADWRGLGDLIHRLVLHRPAPRRGVGGVSASKAWTRLGKGGEGLRRLCSRLLVPDLDPARLTLDQVAAELDRLARPPRVPALTVLAATLAALTVGALVLWAVIRGSEPPPEAPPEWEQVCRAYDAWFYGLLGEVGDPAYLRRPPFELDRRHLQKVAKRRNRWNTDDQPQLRQVVEQVDRFLGRGYPLAIRDGYADIPDGRRKSTVMKALRIVQDVAGRLSPAGDWPALAAVRDTGRRWQSRGWTRRADYLSEPLRRLKRDKYLAQTVDAILHRADRLRQWKMAEAWAGVQACREALRRAPDAQGTPLERFAEFLDRETAEDPSLQGATPREVETELDRLANRLHRWTGRDGQGGLVTRMTRFVVGPWPEAIHREAVGRYPPEAAGGTEEERFDRWLAAVTSGDYDVIPLPSGVLRNLREPLRALAGRLDAARAELDAWPAPVARRCRDERRTFADRLDAARTAAGDLADRVDRLTAESWCLAKVRQEGSRVRSLADDIEAAVDAARRLGRRIWTVELAALAGVIEEDVTAVLALWPPTPDRTDVQNQVEACKTRRRRLAEALRRLPPEAPVSEPLPTGIRGLRTDVLALWGNVTAHPARKWQDHDWRQRRQAIRDALPDLEPDDRSEVTRRLQAWQGEFDTAVEQPFAPGRAGDLGRRIARLDTELKTIEDLVDPRRIDQWNRAVAEYRRQLGTIDPAELVVEGLGDAGVLKDWMDRAVRAATGRLDAIDRLVKKVPTGAYAALSEADKQTVKTLSDRVKTDLRAMENQGVVANCLTGRDELRRLAGAVSGLLGASTPVPLAVFRPLWSRERRLIAEMAVADLPDVIPSGFAEKRTARLTRQRDHLGQLVAAVAAAFDPGSDEPLLDRERARRLKGAVADLPDPLPYAQLPPPDAPDADWLEPVGLAGVRQDWAALVRALPEVRRAGKALAAGLAAGRGLDESPAGAGPKGIRTDETVRALYRTVTRSPAFAVREVQEAWADAARRVRALEAIADAAAEADLRTRALDPKPGAGHFEHTLAAWRKLGRQPYWPTGAERLQAERRIRDALRGAVPDSNRPLRRELAERGRRRWVRYFAALREPDALEAAVDEVKSRELDLDFDLVALADDSEPGKGDIADLVYAAPGADQARPLESERVRYNVLRYRFKAYLEARQGDEAAAARAQRAFVRLARRWAPRRAAREPLKGFLREVEHAKPESDSKGADLAQAGPGSVRWAMASKAPEHLRYTWTNPQGEAFALAFRLVKPPGAKKGGYLCTTEVSVGLFKAVMDYAAEAHPGEVAWRNPAVRTWLTAVGKILRGPRGWHGSDKDFDGTPDTVDLGYSSGTGRWIYVAPWYTVRDERDPEFAPQPEPTARHPMNRIPAHLALYAARLVGCRLPTPGEWTAAYTSMGRTTEGWNLAGRAWRKQRDHARRMEELIRAGPSRPFSDVPCYPDEGIFRPAGRKGPQEPHEVPPADPDRDDGHLWFAPVDSDAGHAFHHLVGNVAEYVCGAAAAQDALASDRPDSRAAFQALSGGTLHVIGASALSPEGIRPDAAYPCRPGAEPDTFSDVGFRLAFTAPRATLSQLLLALLETPDGGYLAGPAPSTAGR